MKRLSLSAQDIAALLALVGLTIGSFLVWLPLGFIVPSALVLIYIILPDRAEPST